MIERIATLRVYREDDGTFYASLYYGDACKQPPAQVEARTLEGLFSQAATHVREEQAAIAAERAPA